MPIDVVVQERYGDAFAVVEVAGEVDAANCGVLAEALGRAGDRYPVVVVDLTQVGLLSAAGLHCLDCAEVAVTERQGALHLVSPESSPVRSMMRHVQLHHSWPVHRSMTQALRQVTQQLLAAEVGEVASAAES